ncbi:MAG: hypothetical protein V7629_03615 [Motiliproteus sp.]
MSLQRLSRQLDQDVNYLIWRAGVYQQSQLDLLLQFSVLASNYRRLVAADQQAQLESLIASYRSRFN